MSSNSEHIREQPRKVYLKAEQDIIEAETERLPVPLPVPALQSGIHNRGSGLRRGANRIPDRLRLEMNFIPDRFFFSEKLSQPIFQATDFFAFLFLR